MGQTHKKKNPQLSDEEIPQADKEGEPDDEEIDSDVLDDTGNYLKAWLREVRNDDVDEEDKGDEDLD
jgi:hypothetical protein